MIQYCILYAPIIHPMTWNVHFQHNIYIGKYLQEKKILDVDKMFASVISLFQPITRELSCLKPFENTLQFSAHRHRGKHFINNNNFFFFCKYLPILFIRQVYVYILYIFFKNQLLRHFSVINSLCNNNHLSNKFILLYLINI